MTAKRGPDPQVVERIREMIAQQQPDLLTGFDEVVAAMPARRPRAARGSLNLREGEHPGDRPMAELMQMSKAELSSAAARSGVPARPNWSKERIAGELRAAAARRLAPDPVRELKMGEMPDKPAVPVKFSITPAAIVSLIDGSKHTDIRPHLKQRGVTLEQYARQFDLPPDYPVLAPNEVDRRYDAVRTTVSDDEFAKRFTIGAELAPSESAGEAEAAPQPEKPQRDTAAEFLRLLAGKTPRAQWASSLGVTEKELKPHIDRALAKGFLRRDRNGVIRRNPAALKEFEPETEIVNQKIERAAEQGAAAMVAPGRIEGADIAMTPAAIDKAAEIKGVVTRALAGILPRDVRVDVVDTIEIGRLAREDELLSLRSSKSATVDEGTEGESDESVSDASAEAGGKGRQADAGQSTPGGAARAGERGQTPGDRSAEGLAGAAEQRIVRQESISRRADGSVIVGRLKGGNAAKGGRGKAAMRPGAAEPFAIEGFEGRVTAENLESADRNAGNLARLTYKVTDGGKEAGLMELVQREDGAWEIDFVEATRPRKGVGSALYAAVEADLGIRMSPSGVLSDEGLAFWKKRSPESVKWHMATPTWGGFNFSPAKVKSEIERVGRELGRISRAEGRAARIPQAERDKLAAGYRKERGQLIALWAKMPIEARAATPTMFSLRAFHGSPHDFDRFDMSKIGTGEGAQVFGHGLYFAEAEAVARKYQVDVSEQLARSDPIAHRVHRATETARTDKEALEFLRQRMDDAFHETDKAVYRQAVERFDEIVRKLRGQFYEVEIDVEPERLLDWDKPLSEQTKGIREKVAQILPAPPARGNWEIRSTDGAHVLMPKGHRIGDNELSVPLADIHQMDDGKWWVGSDTLAKEFKTVAAAKRAVEKYIDKTIKDLDKTTSGGLAYSVLEDAFGSREGASQALREAGIPGIRYLDQGSRDAGDGTRNIVIFDDSLIKITHKNGKPVTAKERQDAVDAMFAARLDDASGQLEALGQTDLYAQTISIAVRAIEAEARRTGKSMAKVATQAARHEALEFFQGIGLIRPQEWSNLRATAIAENWIDETGVREPYTAKYGSMLPPAELEELILKEAIMEKYGAYERGEFAPKGVVRKVMERVKNFLQSVMNGLRGLGFERWEDIFQKVDAGELRKRYEAIYGDSRQRAAPDFWDEARKLDADLSGKAAEAIDGWVGGPHDAVARGSIGGLMMPDRLEKMADAELEDLARPMRAALRATYGDVLTVFRGEAGGGGQSVGRKNRLYAYSLDRAVAENFAGAQREVDMITEADIARAERELAATGETKVGHRALRKEGGAIWLYDRDGQAITDVESVRAEAESQNAYAAEKNAERSSALARVREVQIPVESVVWATDRFNQKEIIAFAGREMATRKAQPMIRAGQIPDARGQIPTPGQAGELKGIAELIDEFKRAIGLTARTGRLDPGLKRAAKQAGGELLGQYNGVARTKIQGDIDILTHEGGHHLERTLGADLTAIMQANQAELTPLATALGNPLSEGFAEFFRRYVTNPTAAAARAPGFFRDFEDLLDASNPEMLERLQSIQREYDRFLLGDPVEQGIANQTVVKRTQNAFSKGLSDIERDGFVSTIGDRLHTLYYNLISQNHGWWIAVRDLLGDIEARTGQRISLAAKDNPNKLIRMISHTAAWAQQDLKDGIALRGRPNGGGVSMHQVLATAFGGTDKSQWNERATQEFGEYLIARRAIHQYVRFRPAFRQQIQQFVAANPSLAFILQRLPNNIVPELERPPTKESLTHQLMKLKALEQRQPQFRQAAELYYAFNRDIIRFLHEKQLITKEERDEYLQDRDYAPFQRDMSDKEPARGEKAASKRPGRAADTANKNDVYRRFEGSMRDIINPIQSTVQLVYEMRLRAAVNDTLLAMDRLADQAGPAGKEIFERVPAHEAKAMHVNMREALRQSAKAAGMSPTDTAVMLTNVENQIGQNVVTTMFTQQKAGERGERIVWFYKDGEAVPAQIADGELGRMMFEGLTANGYRNMDLLTKILSFPANIVRFGVTASFEFIFRNIFVDSIVAPINSPYSRSILTAAAGARDIARGGRSHQLYNRYAGMLGGEFSTSISDQSIQRDVEALRRKGFKVRMPKNALDLFRLVFTGLGEASESSTRVGIFRNAMQSAIADGMSEHDAAIEAAHYAHDVMDFSRHGSKTETLRRTIPFWNAAIQGMDKYFRTLAGANDYGTLIGIWQRYRAGQPLSVNEQKAVGQAARAWTWSTVVLGGVSLLFAYLGEDDEDQDEITDQLRATHWRVSLDGILYLLPKSVKTFMNWDDDSDVTVRLPKPFEIAWFANAVERAYDGARKGDKTAFEGWLKDFWSGVAPPDSMPGLDLTYGFLTGKDLYSGRDIIPTWEKDLERPEQFGPYTTETARRIGKGVNMSPYYVDYLVRGVGASLGRDVTTLIDIAAQKGPLPSIEEYPIFRRFTYNTGRNSKSIGKFYDMTSDKEGLNAWFWDTVSSDARSFNAAANTYKRLQDAKKDSAAADYLNRINPDQRVFAILSADFEKGKAKLRNLHPIINAQEAITVTNNLMKEVVDGTLLLGKKGEERKPIDREQARFARNEIGHIRKGIAQNALRTLEIEGWAQQKLMDVDARIATLKAGAPEIHAELMRRLKAKDVQKFSHIAQVWGEVRRRVLQDKGEAQISDLAYGKVEGY